MNISPITNNTYNRPYFGTRLDKSLIPYVEKGVSMGIIGEKELNNLKSIANDGLQGQIWLETDFGKTLEHCYGTDIDRLVFDNPVMQKLRKKYNKVQRTTIFPVNIEDKIEFFITEGKFLHKAKEEQAIKEFVEIMTPENIKMAHQKSQDLENLYAQKEINDKKTQDFIDSLFD